MRRTISLPIQLDKLSYNEMAQQCQQVYDKHIEWAFENHTYNKNKAHSALYDVCRSLFPNLPSALIQCVRDVALEAVKRLKFKKKPTKKTMTLRFDKRTMTLRGNVLTFSSIGKRQKVVLHIPEYFKNVYTNWSFKGGTICKQGNRYWCKLVFEFPDPEISVFQDTLGIDLGLYNIATLSNGQIFKAKLLRKIQRQFLYNRRKLQAKGTHSAKRRLSEMSGKEMRFSQDFIHCLVNQIVRLPFGTFAIENLKNLRKQRRGKKLNKWISSFPFHKFKMFLTYKAQALGKKVVEVDPRYTSKKCSCCGHIHKQNRHKSKFVCNECGYQNHADVNAALNIRQNALLSTNKSDRQAPVNELYATVSIVGTVASYEPCAHSG